MARQGGKFDRDNEISFTRAVADRYKQLMRSAPPKGVSVNYCDDLDDSEYIKQALLAVLGALGSDLRGKSMLDIGCGRGSLSIFFAKLGAQVTAIDISPDIIELAKDLASLSDAKDNPAFLVSDINEIKHPPFDFVFGCGILHHLDLNESLKIIRRLVRHGGKAIFIEPYADTPLFSRLRRLLGIPIMGGGKSDNEHLLNEGDLTAIGSYFNGIQITYYHLFSRLDRVVRNKSVIGAIRKLDSFLLSRLSYLRKYSRQIVLILEP